MIPDHLHRCAEYIAAVKPGVGEKRYFAMYLNRYDQSGDAHAQLANIGNAFAATFATSLRPLLAKAELCRVYKLDGAIRSGEIRAQVEGNLARHQAQRGQWLAAYTKPHRGAVVEVNLAADDVLDDVSFWWWLIGVYVHAAFVVILVPASKVDPAVDFAPLLDPTAFGDLGSSGRSAFQAAKRATAGGDRVAFLPGCSGSRVNLGVVAESSATEQLFEAAIVHSGLTPEFVRQYATYEVLPIEIGGYGVWIRLNSNQNDWSILTSALEQAERLGDEDVGALTEGLVAAELVASLFGKPPAVFSRSEPKRAAALREWAERWAARAPLAQETRELALRVVRRTAATSVLPQRLWRTEEPRRLWYLALADLAARLE